jgi:integrase
MIDNTKARDSTDTKELPPSQSERTLIQHIPYDERFISNRLGYTVEVRDYAGAWLKEIIWPDDKGGRVALIKTDLFFTGEPDIDNITSAFLYHLLTQYIGTTVQLYAKGIELFTSEIIQGKDVEEALNSAVTHIRNDSDLTAIKALVQWFVAYELEGLSYDFSQEVMKLSRGGAQNSYATLFSLDAELGPFTREENAVLRLALNNTYIHIEDRVILALCMIFGLRPIQISLLKQGDFIERPDMGLSYLNVPRVKQRQPTRRTQFTKRILKPEIADLIRDLIKTHQQVFADIDIEDPPLIMRRYYLFDTDHPYKKVSANYYSGSKNPNWIEDLAHKENPYQSIYDDNNRSDAGHHIDSSQIDYRLKCIAYHLPLSPRTGRPFNLTAYRFRYTVGTTAVLEGMTEVEVADLLDHSNVGSVKHYFRYTREMFEILEEATNKRVEQQHFVAAWVREGDQKGNIYGNEIIETRYFTAIGKCQKDSACMLEPAVACYQCDKFCPSKDLNAHKNALANLKEKVESLKANATGSVSHQLDEAVAGCEAAIAYSEGKQVNSICGGGMKTIPVCGGCNE